MQKIAKVYANKKNCKKELQKAIKTNLKEFKNPKQAIAISYAQLYKVEPNCGKHLRGKRPIKKKATKKKVTKKK